MSEEILTIYDPMKGNFGFGLHFNSTVSTYITKGC